MNAARGAVRLPMLSLSSKVYDILHVPELTVFRLCEAARLLALIESEIPIRTSKNLFTKIHTVSMYICLYTNSYISTNV